MVGAMQHQGVSIEFQMLSWSRSSGEREETPAAEISWMTIHWTEGSGAERWTSQRESVVPLQLVVFFCLHRRNPLQSRFAEAAGREVYLPVSDQHVTSNDDMQSMQCFSVLEVLRLSNRLLG